ncbi:hypothetical protein PACTADRAFT_49649 [Pachysolen tannophilus NRRL Y-2460]|uniref:Uncharacterized protein n=1 Tax=Pachysolen tannophilus NRRL Y-2460 TaxID=669874 RepID=A0A1E4TX06_PACTA|nr:hypothetical protein PACTADRAFT_49649 [Pachysolen tannophilus NRRL Y-2460]
MESSLLLLPHEVIFRIFDNLIPASFSSPHPPNAYKNNVLEFINPDKSQLKDLINLSLTNRYLRSLSIMFLKDRNHGELFLSLARDCGLPTAIQYSKNICQSLLSCIIGDEQILNDAAHGILFSHNVNYLEIRIDDLNTAQWLDLVSIYHDKLNHLKVLGPTESFQEVFYMIDNFNTSSLLKFKFLQKLSIPLPNSTYLLDKLGYFFNWNNLKNLNLFIEPFTFEKNLNDIEKTFQKLNFFFEGNNELIELNLISGNSFIYYNNLLLLEVSKFLLNFVNNLQKLSIRHDSLRYKASFSSYNNFDSSFDSFRYRDNSFGFEKLFQSINLLKKLAKLSIDADLSRKFCNEVQVSFNQRFGINTIYDNIKIAKYRQDHNIFLELEIVEPTFVYPISLEQRAGFLQIILILKDLNINKLSLKYGLQLELALGSHVKFILDILTTLGTSFKYTKITYVSFELISSTIDDSIILEHNEKFPNDHVDIWERIDSNSPDYKNLEFFKKIKYINQELYQDIKMVDYVRIMNGGLKNFDKIQLYADQFYSEEQHDKYIKQQRLDFWNVECLLKDFIRFDVIGVNNRHGVSIFQ